MPVVLGAAFSFITHIWWLGLLVLPVMGTLCLGYFGTGFWGRGLWMALQAAVIGIGACITGHFAWFLYVPCVISALLAGGLLYGLDQIEGDAIFGVILSLPVFCIS